MEYLSGVLSRAKRVAKKYTKKAKHNYGLYSGKEHPLKSGNRIVYHEDNINEVYPIIELQRFTIGYRYPRINLRAKRPYVFIRRVRGNPNRYISEFMPDTVKNVLYNDYLEENKQIKYFQSQVFKQMTLTGTPIYTTVEDIGGEKEEVDYIVLDGNRSAFIQENAVNYVIEEKGIDEEINKVKDDAFITPLAVLWIDYVCPYHIPIVESNKVKRDDIYAEKLTYGKDFLCDPAIKSFSNIHKGKWVARSHWVSKEDLEVLKDVKTPDDKPLFRAEAIDAIIGGSSSAQSYKYGLERDIDDEDNKEPYDDELGESQKVQGYKIWQVWEKPSLKEMFKGDEFSNGKVTYVLEGYKGKFSDPFPWPHKNDSFPCEILYFNADCEDELIPVSDIEIYEALLADNNFFRHAQKQLAELSSRIKGILNSDNIQPKDLNKLMQELKDPAHTLSLVPGFKKDDFFQLVMGSHPTPLWQADQKIQQEIQKASMTSDARKGLQRARVSATQDAIMDRSAATRDEFRQYIYGQFYKRVVKQIICLQQQYYDAPRMIEIMGDTGIEWVEYNKDLIQGEHDIYIDILSMNPNDIMTQRQELAQLLNMLLSIFDKPERYTKILSEGKQIVFTELLDQILKRMDLINSKITPKVSEQVQQAASQVLTNMLLMGGSGGKGGAPMAVPGMDIQPSQQEGKTGGQYLDPGAVMPPGGPPKVEERA